MPNLKYSGSKGVVQSTGLGQFHVSGVGIAHDVETITLDANKSGKSYGVSLIEVDGGIKLDNGQVVLDAGADVLVSGSGVFGQPNPVLTIKEFKALKSYTA